MGRGRSYAAQERDIQAAVVDWPVKRLLPSEKQIQSSVVEHWKTLGLPDTLVAAIPNARAFGQAGLTRGLPDLMALGPRVPNQIAFIELKRERGGPVSDEQLAFGGLTARLGLTWKLAYGRDEPIRLLELWGVVRASVRDGERERSADPRRGPASVEAELDG